MAATVTMTPPPTLRADPQLRSALLDYYLDYATSAELIEWLQDIGLDTKGGMDEKRERVRNGTKYLAMPAADFPQQTIHYLEQYSSSNHLIGICEALGLDPEGSRDTLWRRIMREVAFREGWLPRPTALTETAFTGAFVRPFVDWHLVTKRGQYEKDCYPGFLADMEDAFGKEYVYEQLPVASGTTLRIDFHLGHPQRGGVGVEFKMPRNNAELQRALGQIDQYQDRYGANLLVVLFPDFLDKAQLALFAERLGDRTIPVIVK